MHGEIAADRPAHLRAAVRRPPRPAHDAGADDRSAQRSRLRAAAESRAARASSRSAATRWRSSRAAATSPARPCGSCSPSPARAANAGRALRPIELPVKRAAVARGAASSTRRCSPRSSPKDAKSGATCRSPRSRRAWSRPCRDRRPPLLRSPRRRRHRHDARGVHQPVRQPEVPVAAAARITQQLVRNTFLSSMWGLDKAREKSAERKFTEWLMSVALERRLSKDEILELYLNDVYLGQRGSFAIHGVPEAARLFFGKDVSNLSLAEAATIAGVIQAPPRYSPFNNPGPRARSAATWCCTRWRTAASSPRTPPTAPRTSRCRSSRARSNPKRRTSSTTSARSSRSGTKTAGRGRRLHDARSAPAADRAGRGARRARHGRRDPREAQAQRVAAGRADRRRSAHGRDPRDGRRPVLQPVAVQPRGQRQAAARLGVQAVRLSRRVRARAGGRPHRRHARHRRGRRADVVHVQRPGRGRRSNYENEYDGPITLRRALAHVAQHRDDQGRRVDRLRQRRGAVEAASAPARRRGRIPSIALGVFEATPFEIATAYTLFPNGGTIRPLRAICASSAAARTVPIDVPPPKTVARKDTTFLVTNMMRSVLNEGTGAGGARRRASRSTRAGKSGTTNDLRDAWFVGFTPELLTVVWVGLDDNQALGLSGSQAALPIWTAVHDARARRPPEHGVRCRPTASCSSTSTRHRQARHPGLPARLPRVVPRRHRADGALPAAQSVSLPGVRGRASARCSVLGPCSSASARCSVQVLAAGARAWCAVLGTSAGAHCARSALVCSCWRS